MVVSSEVFGQLTIYPEKSIDPNDQVGVSQYNTTLQPTLLVFLYLEMNFSRLLAGKEEELILHS